MTVPSTRSANGNIRLMVITIATSWPSSAQQNTMIPMAKLNSENTMDNKAIISIEITNGNSIWFCCMPIISQTTDWSVLLLPFDFDCVTAICVRALTCCAAEGAVRCRMSCAVFLREGILGVSLIIKV